MKGIMAKCYRNRHILICIQIHIHIGWLNDEPWEKYRGVDRAIVNNGTRSGHCLALRFFYSSDIYNLPLASRNNARGFAYATVSGRGNIA